jgi:hypothetical protein
MNEDWRHFNALLTVLVVLYACVFVSVLIDLFFGVKRAKRLKIVRTSFGYRRTITKLTSYFGLMLMLSIADIAASVVFKMPYFTVVGAIGIVIVEAKSVFENLKRQEKNVEEVQKILLKIFENRDEIQALITCLNSKKTGGSAMKSRGLRNNNPLNIRHNADVFQGEIKGADKSFKTFSSMPYGYRAAFVTLATYLSRGWNTVEKIISHWAPPNENNTDSYIAAVEKWSGAPRNKELTTADGADYILIVAAMSFVENGKNANISEVKAGFNLQTKIKLQ